jgi:PEP-CTERM putative exosortase interaction domain
MNTCPGAAASSFGFLARLVTVGVLSGASVAGMAATIVFTSALPTEDVFKRNDNLSGTASIQVRNTNAVTNNRLVGVGFTAPENTSLDRFTFHIAFSEGNGLVGDPAKGATMKIEIVELASLLPVQDQPLTYTLLHSETAVVPATYLNEAYMTFDLETSVGLSASKYYGIILSFTETASNRGINFRQSSNGVTGTNGLGNVFHSVNSWGTTSTGAPLAFVLQTTPPSNIPEPSSAALLLGGVSLGAVALRRRGRAGRR